MLKLHGRRLSERMRMLLIMLAVILPAAALIIASVMHLRTLQREKEIEAVIQREYSEELAVAEKRIDHRAYKMAEGIQETFPDVDSADELDDFLRQHPNVSHAFLWTGKGHLD
ncbi:MAG: sensor histidine kinase, partial [Candidatus Sulfotelmatobacter sp.]